VSSLRANALANAQRLYSVGAARAARMVDLWADERESDAKSLAEIAAVHGSDSLTFSPAVAGRILRLQMAGAQRRAHYLGLWIFGETGHVIASVDGHVPIPAEDSAVLRAIATGTMQVSRPARRDSLLTIGIAEPIVVAEKGGRRAEGAVLIRDNLDRAFTNGATARPLVAPVILVPTGASYAGLTLCPAPALTICVMPAMDTLRRLAFSAPSSFRRIALRDGRRLLVATHRTDIVPWGVYYAVDEDAQLAVVRARLRSEALLFAGLLLVVIVGLYAYDRSTHLRRLTERAQSEARFSAIVDTAMDAIIIVNDRYEIVVVNRAAESMFAYTRAELLGRSVLDLVPEVAKGELRGALEQTLVGGLQPRLFSAERYAAGCRRDGSTFPIDVGISRTQMDARPHLTIVIRDITDWRRVEENSEWQRRVLESIATGTELREVLSRIIRFQETQCPGVECVVHLMDDDGVTLRTIAAPSMRPEFVEAMDEIVVGPRAATCGSAVYRHEMVVSINIASDVLWNDYRALALEQGYRSSWATPIRSPQGRILGAFVAYAREARSPSPTELRVAATATQLAGIAVDRAHAAQSIRQSEASFRSFVENSPIGIYRSTGTGRLLAVNASLVQLLGYNSSGELLRVDMARDIFASVMDRERLFRQLEANGELRSADMDWRRKDGSTLTVRVSARAYRDERGSVWLSEGFVENVTPLRVAEQALRQSEKLAALGQLVSGVAHELNNPLAAILHFAEDLLDDERTSSDLEALSIIRDQARRSRAIVRDLLSFVRFRDAVREQVQLTDALASSVKALRPVIRDLGATLVAELPDANAEGHTDPAGLQQVVTNLVVNGAQASGRGGTVTLRATVADGELSLVVEDTGPGIPPRVMDRIFEPFFTTKPLGEGTGLGLSVTLGIVQQLGGRINVENRAAADGGGARFVVALPIDGGGTGVSVPRTIMVESVAVATDGASPDSAPRALIIDDEPSIRAALRRFFDRRGWQVEEAADGSDGLSALLAGKFEYAVVISDLKMPGCSGIELHDHVAAVAPELLDRVIFSTGDVASREAAEFVQRTRCAVLQKPFELRALEAVVARMRQLAAT
jgi:PAS domain S-box-containing protein